MTIKQFEGAAWLIVGAAYIFGVMPAIELHDVAGLLCFSIGYRFIK